MNRLTIFSLLLSLSCACGKSEDNSSDKKSEVAQSEDITLAEIAKSQPPKVERDSRLVALFTKGKDCKWDESGHTQCPADKEINKLAFNNQGSKVLAASCAAAFSDPAYHVRGLAISCVRGFNDSARTPVLALGIDAYEKEKDLGFRHALSWALRGNAKEAGVEARTIELVGKLAKEPSTEIHAANFLTMLFPQYVMGNSAPSKEAGDAALGFTKNSSKVVQRRAVEILGQLKDRSEEVCPVLVELTTEDYWTSPILSRAKLGESCLRDLDTVIGYITAKLESGNFFSGPKMALTQILKIAVLSKTQVKT